MADPYTVVLFLWRKPGISPGEFKTHWETVHIPLLKSLTGDLFPQSHTRFYLARTPKDAASADTSNANYAPNILVGEAEDFDYDAFAQVVFKSQADFGAFFAYMQSPDIAAKVHENEERFILRQKIKAVQIEDVKVTSK